MPVYTRVWVHACVASTDVPLQGISWIYTVLRTWEVESTGDQERKKEHDRNDTIICGDRFRHYVAVPFIYELLVFLRSCLPAKGYRRGIIDAFWIAISTRRCRAFIFNHDYVTRKNRPCILILLKVHLERVLALLTTIYIRLFFPKFFPPKFTTSNRPGFLILAVDWIFSLANSQQFL